MMRGFPALLAIFLAVGLLVCGPRAALAQAEDWTEVVVKGRLPPGPAMWRIEKGQSQVVILGTLPVFPKRQAWNTKRTENALRGARGLITPAASQMGAGDTASLVMRKGLPGGKTLKAVVPPALYQRYIAAAARAGVPVKDFEHDKPVWAGVRLRREVLQKRGLSDDEPVDTVKRLARRAGVPIRAAGRYDMGRIIKDVNAMSDQAAQACLGYTLDDIDFDIDRAARAATAWAVGDLAGVRANYQGSALVKCLNGSGKGASLAERSVNDTVTAVETALKTPGKTLVVVPLAVLLRQGGALERLRAHGYTVSSPGE